MNLSCVKGHTKRSSPGIPQTHDRIVRQYLQELMAKTDVVILAQASMARVANTIPAEEQAVPILSSPRLAMERARSVIEQGGA